MLIYKLIIDDGTTNLINLVNQFKIWININIWLSPSEQVKKVNF